MSIVWQKSTGLRAGKNVHCVAENTGLRAGKNVHCVAEKYRAESREECPLRGRKVQG